MWIANWVEIVEMFYKNYKVAENRHCNEKEPDNVCLTLQVNPLIYMIRNSFNNENRR